MTKIDEISLTLGRLLEGQDEVQRNVQDIKTHLKTLNGTVGKTVKVCEKNRLMINSNMIDIESLESKRTKMLDWNRMFILKMVGIVTTLVVLISQGLAHSGAAVELVSKLI